MLYAHTGTHGTSQREIIVRSRFLTLVDHFNVMGVERCLELEQKFFNSPRGIREISEYIESYVRDLHGAYRVYKKR